MVGERVQPGRGADVQGGGSARVVVPSEGFEATHHDGGRIDFVHGVVLRPFEHDALVLEPLEVRCEGGRDQTEAPPLSLAPDEEGGECDRALPTLVEDFPQREIESWGRGARRGVLLDGAGKEVGERRVSQGFRDVGGLVCGDSAHDVEAGVGDVRGRDGVRYAHSAFAAAV